MSSGLGTSATANTCLPPDVLNLHILSGHSLTRYLLICTLVSLCYLHYSTTFDPISIVFTMFKPYKSTYLITKLAVRTLEKNF